MARVLSVVAGITSIVSGAALAFAPKTTAKLYGLPDNERFSMVLGMRDVVIGAGLVHGGAERGFWLARAVSDGVDTALIARRALERREWFGIVRIAMGLGAVAVGLRRAASS
jgi:hypothetical protein